LVDMLRTRGSIPKAVSSAQTLPKKI